MGFIFHPHVDPYFTGLEWIPQKPYLHFFRELSKLLLMVSVQVQTQKPEEGIQDDIETYFPCSGLIDDRE